jgi:hypothetical protein
MTAISPVSLRARREALGVSRELVASFGPEGVNASIIRDLEKGSTHFVRPWHIAAIERLEWWVEDTAREVEQRIGHEATMSNIEGRPVIWFMPATAFDASPFRFLCLDRVELYTLCLMNVREDFIDKGERPIDAEMLPSKYDAFRAELGINADHPAIRAKWWRHWSKQYRVEE